MTTVAPKGPHASGRDAPVDPALTRVAIAGRLAALGREEASRLVEAAGGRLVRAVTHRTTLLVVGAARQGDATATPAYARAERLLEAGLPLRIVSEGAFLQMLGLVARPAEPGAGAWTREAACRILDLDAATLRRWEALGLVAPQSGRLDFRDLVALRTVRGLEAQGVAAAEIARASRGFARALPAVRRPLVQLRLLPEGGGLLADRGGSRLAPDGQYVIGFDADADAGAAAEAPTSLPVPAIEAGPEEWFAAALAHEDDEAIELAIRAYRRAIAAQPLFAAAHFNLANLLRDLGRLGEAEAHFFVATTQAPEMAEAWYNLADVQEDRGRIEEAIESLRTAVSVAPGFADAHWNLALFCEEAGQDAEARRHWEVYLRLDPGGAWAAEARRRLGR